MKRLENEEMLEIPLKDRTLLQTKEIIDRISQTNSPDHKRFLTLQLMHDLISSAKVYSDAGDFYEAAEIFYSAGYLFEETDFKQAQALYEKAIDQWKAFIEKLVGQGKFREIADIHNKISHVYERKFNAPGLQQQHQRAAISYYEQNANMLEQFGELKKVVHDLHNIAVLHADLHEWEEVLVVTRRALELAKQLKYFEIYASLVEIRADAFNQLGRHKELREGILKAIDVLTMEALTCEENDEIFNASQIYEILKRLHKQLPDARQYEFFAIKEASMYQKMAEQELLRADGRVDLLKVANFYRGAGLCYKEVEKDLDTAACFYLAAQHFDNANDYYNGAQNLSDAGIFFQNCAMTEKAREMFLESGRQFELIGDLELAAENFLAAFDLLDVDVDHAGGSPVPKKSSDGPRHDDPVFLASKISDVFQQLAREQLARKNFHVAGTLFLEAARYLAAVFRLRKKIGYFLRLASSAFTEAVERQHFAKDSLRYYAGACAVLAQTIVGEHEKARAIMGDLTLHGNGQVGYHYVEVAQLALETVARDLPEMVLPAHLERVVKNAPELQKLLSFLSRTLLAQ